jgi:hypothetical protein
MDKPAALTGEEVTFVVEQVDADAIAILPYGADETGKGGVLIPKSAFENSVATVKFSYEFVGSFSPVVVASNFTGDGKSIERTYSDARSITITSNKTSITEFSFDGSTKTTIKEDLHTIEVEMPWENDKGVHYDVTALKAKFSASPFTTVTIGSTPQESGTTVTDFSNPVTYTVTADDGTTSTYEVTVVQIPEETSPDLKSFNGNSISTTYKNKPIQGYIDNGNRYIVMLAPHGQIADVFDSVRVKYETEGKFSILHYATEVDTLTQDSLLNFIITQKSVTVEAQEETIKATYPIFTAIAPKLELSFQTLNPAVVGKTELFDITLKTLKTTPLTALATTAAITEAHAGQGNFTMETVPIDSNDANDLPIAFASGNNVNFTTPVKFIVTFTDTNLPGKTIKVEYTVTVVGLE